MQSSEETIHRHVPTAGVEPPVAAKVLSDHTPDEEHIHLPPPSIWPVSTAFGVALAGFGLVSSYWFSLVGILIMGYSLMSWVQELRHEPH